MFKKVLIKYLNQRKKIIDHNITSNSKENIKYVVLSFFINLCLYQIKYYYIF